MSDRINKINNIFPSINKQNINGFTQTISLLQDNLTIEEANLICNELSLCNCCDRHKERKPTSIEKEWVEYPRNNNNHYYDFDHYYNTCNCNCRHISRFLNRAFSNYLDNQ